MGASAPLVQSLIPDTQDNSLSFSVLNYLKRLKNQAKIEFEKLCADVINKASSSNNQKVIITDYLSSLRVVSFTVTYMVFLASLYGIKT